MYCTLGDGTGVLCHAAAVKLVLFLG